MDNTPPLHEAEPLLGKMQLGLFFVRSLKGAKNFPLS
jgi:hypothetical protein